MALGLPALRLADAQGRHRAQESGHRREEERRPPAPGLRDRGAERVGEAEADRKAEHEDGHRARPLGLRIEITQQRRGGRGTGRLADTDEQPHAEQLPEALRDARQPGEDTPGEHAACQDATTVAAIGEPSERHADNGIEKGEGRAERAQRGVGEGPFATHGFADRPQQLAIEEVHQVDEEQHRERVAGA